MRTSRVGLLHVCQNLLCIALQITNSHVYLSKCHSKGYDIHEKIPFSSECIEASKDFRNFSGLFSLTPPTAGVKEKVGIPHTPARGLRPPAPLLNSYSFYI